jgi:hypothetical protein
VQGEPFSHQPINKPIPVVGGFYDNAGKIISKRLKRLNNCSNVVRCFFLEDALAGFINNCQIAVA